MNPMKSGIVMLQSEVDLLFWKKILLLDSKVLKYDKMSPVVKVLNKRYIININEAPIVHQGDAIFHITTE